MSSAAHSPGTTAAPLASARVSPALALQQAVARIEQSRAQLRQSLTPPPLSDGEQRSWRPVRRARAWLRSTAFGSLLEPVLGAMTEDLMQWWGRQGWRQSATQAQQALSAELVPLVRRHPFAAVVVTAAAGALFVSSGVWRWRVIKRGVSQLGTTLGAQLRHLGSSQLANPAIQGLLLSALLSFIGPRMNQRAAAAAQAPGPQDRTGNAPDEAGASPAQHDEPPSPPTPANPGR